MNVLNFHYSSDFLSLSQVKLFVKHCSFNIVWTDVGCGLHFILSKTFTNFCVVFPVRCVHVDLVYMTACSLYTEIILVEGHQKTLLGEVNKS